MCFVNDFKSNATSRKRTDCGQQVGVTHPPRDWWNALSNPCLDLPLCEPWPPPQTRAGLPTASCAGGQHAWPGFVRHGARPPNAKRHLHWIAVPQFSNPVLELHIRVQKFCAGVCSKGRRYYGQYPNKRRQWCRLVQPSLQN